MSSFRKTVIVTGSRDWPSYDDVVHALQRENPDLVVQGGARGADRMAHNWANINKVKCHTVHADWDKYGKKAAGPIRNCKMLDLFNRLEYGEVVVLAFRFNESSGTTHAIREARKRGMTVKVSDMIGRKDV